VNQCLVRFGLLGGHATQLIEQARCNADGNELLGVAARGPAYAAGAAQFFVRGFRNVGEIEPAIRNRPGALCASLVSR